MIKLMPALTLCLGCVIGHAQDVLLNSFEDDECLASLRANTVKLSLSDEHATEGEKSLRIDFGVTDWPNVFLAAGEGYEVIDWTPYSVLAFDAYSPEDEPPPIHVRIDDAPEADGRVHCRQAWVSLPAKKPVTVRLTISPRDQFMRGLPPAGDGGITKNLGTRALDLGHIIALQFFLAKPESEHTLYIDNVRLTAGVSLDDIVDRFGQYTGADWPGKIREEEDLAKQREEEAALLADAPLPPDRDEWGGWSAGPQLEATGWFRVENVDGKWWFVTPTGRLFWSMGLDCVRSHNWGPFEDREYMFTWLPEEGDPLRAFGGKGKGGINSYGMNLYRKYGPDYLEPWLDVTRKRMIAWGFNTIGNWSEDYPYANLRLPFTAPISSGRASAFPGGWRDIADFYTDEWAADAEKRIEHTTGKWREDPYCIGYFVDNELSWGGWGDRARYKLPINALALPGDRKVKQVFTELLRTKHGDISALNQAWGAEFVSWDAFLKEPAEVAEELSDAARGDLGMLLADFAKRYFTVVGELMDKYAPNQLYLGPRFAIAPDEVVMVAREFCDVVSYNIYGRAANIVKRGEQIQRLDKPVLIGEFHFGALDRGMFHGGLGPVQSQEDRGIQYAAYVRAALDQPWCIGAHWFIYADQSLTGRFDGENYNIGFVSGVDTPYPELIRHATEVNFAAYERRGE